jgi:hypothetical protein
MIQLHWGATRSGRSVAHPDYLDYQGSLDGRETILPFILSSGEACSSGGSGLGAPGAPRWADGAVGEPRWEEWGE